LLELVLAKLSEPSKFMLSFEGVQNHKHDEHSKENESLEERESPQYQYRIMGVVPNILHLLPYVVLVFSQVVVLDEIFKEVNVA
jgi:hypothetical protein